MCGPVRNNHHHRVIGGAYPQNVVAGANPAAVRDPRLSADYPTELAQTLHQLGIKNPQQAAVFSQEISTAAQHLSTTSLGDVSRLQSIVSMLYFEDEDVRIIPTSSTEEPYRVQLKITHKDPRHRPIELVCLLDLGSSVFPAAKTHLAIEIAIWNKKRFNTDVPVEMRGLERVQAAMTAIGVRNYNCAAFSGGGAKGAAYIGVIEEFGNARLSQLEKVCGSSAGAITACMVATGCESYEFRACYESLPSGKPSQGLLRNVIRQNMRSMIRHTLLRYMHGRDVRNLNEHQRTLLRKYQFEDPTHDITFRELELLERNFSGAGFKALSVATTLKSDKTKLIPLNAETTPDMPISLAAVASAALPIVYDPVDISPYVPQQTRINLQLDRTAPILAIDGGAVDNLPFELIATGGDRVLNLSFKDNEGIEHVKPSIGDRIKNFLAGTPVYLNRRADQLIMARRNVTPFYIPTPGIATRDFKKASQRLPQLTTHARESFCEWDTEHIPTPVVPLSPEQHEYNHILKTEILPAYYTKKGNNILTEPVPNELDQQRRPLAMLLMDAVYDTTLNFSQILAHARQQLA